jgi:hypothetical protein
MCKRSSYISAKGFVMARCESAFQLFAFSLVDFVSEGGVDGCAAE